MSSNRLRGGRAAARRGRADARPARRPARRGRPRRARPRCRRRSEMYRAALALVGGDLGAAPRATPPRPRSSPPGRGDPLVGRRRLGAARPGGVDGGRPAVGPARLPGRRGRTARDRPRRRRARVLDHRGRPAGRARWAARRPGHASRTPSCSATAVAPDLRGTADMHDGLAELALERGDLAAAAAHLAAQRRARRGGRPAPAPLPLAGGDGRACARPRATSAPRPSCSRRRSACTSATSRPTCGRSPRGWPGCGRPRRPGRRPRLGPAPGPRRPTTRRTSASTST